MTSTIHPTLNTIKAIRAAAPSCCTAAATADLFAAFVSFQRRSTSLSPNKNVNSAISHLVAARQFSENTAIFTAVAATTAKSVTD